MAKRPVHFWPPCKRCGKKGFSTVYLDPGEKPGAIPVSWGHTGCYGNKYGESVTYVRPEMLKGEPPYAPCCSTGTHEGEEDDERQFPPDFFDADS